MRLWKALAAKEASADELLILTHFYHVRKAGLLYPVIRNDVGIYYRVTCGTNSWDTKERITYEQFAAEVEAAWEVLNGRKQAGRADRATAADDHGIHEGRRA
jgi:hypothetical protein